MPVEIACDESGFTGGNLTFRHTVFSHASLRVPVESAREEMARLRLRVAAHGELEGELAAAVVRRRRPAPTARPERSAGRSGAGAPHRHPPVPALPSRRRAAGVRRDQRAGSAGRGHATLGRWRSSCIARATPSSARSAGRRFLVAAGKALRATSRWVPASAVSDFEGELGALAAVPAPAPVREALLRLRAGAGRARAVRRSLEVDSRRPPLLEPLLPALTRCVLGWGAEHRDLVVVHDEQSVLTPWRISDIARPAGPRAPGSRPRPASGRLPGRPAGADRRPGGRHRATSGGQPAHRSTRPEADRPGHPDGRSAIGLARRGLAGRSQPGTSPGVASWWDRPAVRSSCLSRASYRWRRPPASSSRACFSSSRNRDQ